MRRRSILPLIASIAVFLILEAAALWMVRSNGELQRQWMARAGQSFMGGVWGRTEKVKDYFTLKSINEGLAQENAVLTQKLEAAKQQLRQARADSTSLSHGSQGFTLIPAEVVKISRNSQHNYLIINRGFEDGIQEKSGIVTSSGVVGIIDAVSAHHAFAFSFQNSDISISARLGRDGGSGLLVWDGISSRGGLLKEIPLQYKFQPGDTVYTSGHSLMFPPDIPLGVAGQAKVINGSTNEIAVKLFQDFSAIRYVMVVHNNSLEEIEEFAL